MPKVSHLQVSSFHSYVRICNNLPKGSKRVKSHKYHYLFFPNHVLYILIVYVLSFFPRASERRVLLIVEVCQTFSHLHIFSSSHPHIFTSSHLHIFSSSHLLIFTSSHSLLPSCSLALLLSPSFLFLS